VQGSGRLEKRVNRVRRSALMVVWMKRFDFIFLVAWLFAFLYTTAVIAALVAR
jgi:hypothetical protein